MATAGWCFRHCVGLGSTFTGRSVATEFSAIHKVRVSPCCRELSTPPRKKQTKDDPRYPSSDAGSHRLPDDELNVKAQQIVLSHRPIAGSPVELEHFSLQPLDLAAQTSHGCIPDNKVLVKTLCLSVDPYMRTRFHTDTGVEYTQPFEVGKPIASAGIGYVVLCGDGVEGYAPGDLVLEPFDGWPWQTDALLDVDSLTRLPPSLSALIPVTDCLGVVGLTGLTAYFGMLREVSCGADDVVVVSGAGGATGHIALQLALQRGATVIGITGSDEKCDVLRKSLGVHATLNYKLQTKGSLTTRLQDTLSALGCSQAKGVTIYFDNVGGSISDDVIQAMGPDSSIVLCGQISMYDSDEEYPPPVSAAAQGHIDRHHIARNRYIVLNYLDEYGKALSDLCQMRATGRLKSHETWTTGFKNAPSAFVSMMHGGNTGKALVSCADPPLMQQVRTSSLKNACVRFFIRISGKNVSQQHNTGSRHGQSIAAVGCERLLGSTIRYRTRVCAVITRVNPWKYLCRHLQCFERTLAESREHEDN
eukprot:m.44229 g.44229  ORF g.44229 m.44229 type:complete len:532 (+) comp15085_c0_seq2:149-1744(+)